MDADALLPYVTSTAALLALPLDEARALRVAQHLARTAALAEQLQTFDMAPEAEPAELYRPAAFTTGHTPADRA